MKSFTTVLLVYDDAGKMTSKTVTDRAYKWMPQTSSSTDYTIDIMNKVTAEDANTITYDDNGNLETKGSRTLTWSVENYLTKVVESSTTLAEYDYDAMGRRVEKDISGTVTKYVMDGGNVIAELTGADALTYRYVYGPGVDRPIARITPDGVALDIDYYYYDGQGGVVEGLGRYQSYTCLAGSSPGKIRLP